MPSTAAAVCHPDRVRKTSDGLCETCYSRRRYQNDAAYRERKKARGRRHELGASRSCETCHVAYVPSKPHPQNRYCSRSCRDRSPDALQRSRDKDRRRREARRERSEPYRDADVFERDGWSCQLCHRRIDSNLRWPHRDSASIDHIVPISLGGSDELENVQATHLGCNVSKGIRPQGEQLRIIG